MSDELERGLADFKAKAAIAQAKGTCVLCGKPATWSTEAGRREYEISGSCEPCFDELFGEPEEQP